MEGATEPEALQHRSYYKMGLFVYDNAKVVLVYDTDSMWFASISDDFGA